MKIVTIETFIVDAGFRPWIFVKIETNARVTGYGECSDRRSPTGVAGTIEDLAPTLMGQDSRAYETRFWDMVRQVPRQSPRRNRGKGHRENRLRSYRHQGQGTWDIGGGAVRRTDPGQGQAVLIPLRHH